LLVPMISSLYVDIWWLTSPCFSMRSPLEAMTFQWLPLLWGPGKRVLITTILRDPVERLRPDMVIILGSSWIMNIFPWCILCINTYV
jgi:hypothetical protein